MTSINTLDAASPIVGLLVAEWSMIDELLEGLDATAWSMPTALPEWTVHDVVADLIGTESSLENIDPPEVLVDQANLDHVHNEIGAFNERWVQGLRTQSPAQMRDRFREITHRRSTSLAGLRPEDFAAPSWTPAGEGTYERYMEIRLFDCWLHEQDIRSATGQPGHDQGACAEVSIDEIARALPYIMGKKVGVADGLAVTIELIGPVYRTFHVVVEGRASLVPVLDRPAASTLRLSSGLFVNLAGGRTTASEHRDQIVSEGDQSLATHVVEHLGFTI